MEIFYRLRLFWAKTLLRTRIKRTFRNKKFNSLRNAHKIGIVWDGDFVSNFQHITDLYQRLQARGIQVDIVCYYPGKILPDEYTALRYLTCIKRSDLNFFYIPDKDDINDFISTPYEILIDINFRNQFPLLYISGLSKAEFKIGAGGTIESNILDMTLEIPDKENIEFYLQQVEHYLNMINTGV
jgi:hypothetical protein